MPCFFGKDWHFDDSHSSALEVENGWPGDILD
jgi:hypothetical protein